MLPLANRRSDAYRLRSLKQKRTTGKSVGIGSCAKRVQKGCNDTKGSDDRGPVAGPLYDMVCSSSTSTPRQATLQDSLNIYCRRPSSGSLRSLPLIIKYSSLNKKKSTCVSIIYADTTCFLALSTFQDIFYESLLPPLFPQSDNADRVNVL